MTTTPEDAHAGHATPGGQAAMVRDMRNRFWICLIFTVPIFFYSPMGLFTPPQPPFGLKRNLWLFIFATLAIVYPSWPFFVSAWRALRTGALSMAVSVACRPAPIYRGLSQRERVYLRTVSLTGKLTASLTPNWRLTSATGVPLSAWRSA